MCFVLALMALLLWGRYFVGRMKELWNMLLQTMTMCFALALMALLCWGSYRVEKMREYNSLSLPRIDVHGFAMQAPEVLCKLFNTTN